MDILISILSIAISLFFIYNFNLILKKLRDKKIINKSSLLATSSLIVHFLSISVYFIFSFKFGILLSELYLLSCLTYLLYKK